MNEVITITQYEVTEGGVTVTVRRADRSGRDIWTVAESKGGATFEGLEVALEHARRWAHELERVRVLRETADQIERSVQDEIRMVPFPKREP